jgi:hypothetical protein
MWNVQFGVRMRELWSWQEPAPLLTGLTGGARRSDRFPQSNLRAPLIPLCGRSGVDGAAISSSGSSVWPPHKTAPPLSLAPTKALRPVKPLAELRRKRFQERFLESYQTRPELGVVFRHEICIGFDSYWGKTSPPYIYEGSQPIEGNTIESIITFYFLSLTTIFQPPCFSSLELHFLRWRPRACWST